MHLHIYMLIHIYAGDVTHSVLLCSPQLPSTVVHFLVFWFWFIQEKYWEAYTNTSASTLYKTFCPDGSWPRPQALLKFRGLIRIYVFATLHVYACRILHGMRSNINTCINNKLRRTQPHNTSCVRVLIITKILLWKGSEHFLPIVYMYNWCMCTLYTCLSLVPDHFIMYATGFHFTTPITPLNLIILPHPSPLLASPSFLP